MHSQICNSNPNPNPVLINQGDVLNDHEAVKIFSKELFSNFAVSSGIAQQTRNMINYAMALEGFLPLNSFRQAGKVQK